MWNVAEPDVELDVLLGGAQLEHELVGRQRADDVDEQARGQDGGALAGDVALERDAQADLHVGRPQLDAARSCAWICTPDSAWTALRVDAARVTVWSWAKSASRLVVSFM